MPLEVFRLTSAYDNAIYSWLHNELVEEGPFWEDERVVLHKEADLRYGENPHQHAAFYKRKRVGVPGPAPEADEHTLAAAEQLQGKELSYNNYLDTDAAWASVREFDMGVPTCVIIKHLTPCGIASGKTMLEAYKDAWACDTVSAFGGVMAFNQTVTEDVAREIVEVNKQFIEVVIAPDYDEGALKIFSQKENARILRTGGINPPGGDPDIRAVEGGVVMQTVDTVSEDYTEFSCPTTTKPTDEQMDAMLFAWKCCKCVKSNAVILTKGTRTVGIGGGQPNRVNSARIAVEQAGDEAKGAVAASDAFLPFPDTLEVLRDAGVTAAHPAGRLDSRRPLHRVCRRGRYADGLHGAPSLQALDSSIALTRI